LLLQQIVDTPGADVVRHGALGRRCHISHTGSGWRSAAQRISDAAQRTVHPDRVPDMSARTMAALWSRAVTTPCGQTPFVVEEAGRWRSVGWQEAGRRVEELAAGFLALGVRPGDPVGILGRTRLEWTLVDYALISIGAVVVPVYQAATPAERTHVLAHSAARMVVCEDTAEREQIARLAGLRHLELVLTMDDSGDDLAQLGERGRHHLRGDPDVIVRARAAIRDEDLLTLVYTSGTTGPPKGCMLTHRNYRAMVDMTRRIDRLAQPGDVVLLHLPLAHVFARLIQFLAADVGMTIAFCPDVARLGGALRAVRPTLLPSVPRLFETMHAAVLRELAQVRGPRRRLVGAALAGGQQAARRRREGRRLDPYAVSGGAKLVPEVAELFETLGVPILEGYGLTECTAVAAVNRPDRHRIGTVGPPVPGVELKVADDGEVLIRGEIVFAGYYKDKASTRDVLDQEGWLRTGDVGLLDDDGFLTITDRKKDIIVTSTGVNVPPQRLETALRASPYVSEALVFGDARPYLVALLLPDLHAIRRGGGIGLEVRDVLGRVVAEVNRGAAPAERVRGFAVLPRDLRAEEGELTPTLKARRHVCEEHFRDLIESLYPDTRPRPPVPNTPHAAESGESAPPKHPPRA
jgi:long-chain acyl-CoA synthetase